MELTDEYLATTIGPTLRVVAIVFLVLNTFFYALRLISRHLIKARIGWDDIIMILAFLFSQAICIDGLLSLRWGVGYHLEHVLFFEPEVIPDWGKNTFYVLPYLYLVGSCLPKISVLLLYLRAFTVRWLRVCCWVTMAALVVNAIINMFISGFQCNTPEASWNPGKPGMHCGPIAAHMTYTPLPNIVTDVVMLLLPIPIVYRLQASQAVKIGLAATFTIGGLGLVASIIRFVVFLQNGFSYDWTYISSTMMNWTIAEVSTYFISACLLTCRPLLAKIAGTKPATAVSRWIKHPYGSDRSGGSAGFDGGRGSGRPLNTYVTQPGARDAEKGEADAEITPPEGAYAKAGAERQQIMVKRDVSVETTSIHDMA